MDLQFRHCALYRGGAAPLSLASLLWQRLDAPRTAISGCGTGTFREMALVWRHYFMDWSGGDDVDCDFQA
jgi:hypothetical protein